MTGRRSESQTVRYSDHRDIALGTLAGHRGTPQRQGATTTPAGNRCDRQAPFNRFIPRLWGMPDCARYVPRGSPLGLPCKFSLPVWRTQRRCDRDRRVVLDRILPRLSGVTDRAHSALFEIG